MLGLRLVLGTLRSDFEAADELDLAGTFVEGAIAN